MTLLHSGITPLLKPLAVFCSQSQSQQYIKTIRNLGDSWRTLAEGLETHDTNDKDTIIETTFDLRMRIKSGSNDKDLSVGFETPSRQSTTTHEDRPAVEELSVQQPAPIAALHHYCIFADYGTDFIWLNTADPSYDPDDTYVEASEALGSMPSSVAEKYQAWVDTYNDNFKTRCEDTQDYSATVFHNAVEQVAWQVAGYLLAWRIALDPQVGSVEYSTEKMKHLLERGKETVAAIAFLEEQAALLANARERS